MKLFNWMKGRVSQEKIIEFFSCLIKLSENDHICHISNVNDYGVGKFPMGVDTFSNME